MSICADKIIKTASAPLTPLRMPLSRVCYPTGKNCRKIISLGINRHKHSTAQTSEH